MVKQAGGASDKPKLHIDYLCNGVETDAPLTTKHDLMRPGEQFKNGTSLRLRGDKDASQVNEKPGVHAGIGKISPRVEIPVKVDSKALDTEALLNQLKTATVAPVQLDGTAGAAQREAKESKQSVVGSHRTFAGPLMQKQLSEKLEAYKLADEVLQDQIAAQLDAVKQNPKDPGALLLLQETLQKRTRLVEGISSLSR